MWLAVITMSKANPMIKKCLFVLSLFDLTVQPLAIEIRIRTRSELSKASRN